MPSEPRSIIDEAMKVISSTISVSAQDSLIKSTLSQKTWSTRLVLQKGTLAARTVEAMVARNPEVHKPNGSPQESRSSTEQVYTNISMSFPPWTVPNDQWKQFFNSSSITQFLLLAFADRRELQLLHFWLFLGIYLAALLGNGIIITAITCDHHLHTPMYFFLLNLSLLDLGSISTTLPKAMANALWETRDISYPGCAAQLFFFFFFATAEFSLLTIMAYDRYVAICKPLHYGTLLGSRACVHMAAAAWGTGLLYSLLHTANTFSLPLCQGNAVDQFFCEIPQIVKLSCSDSYLREVGLLVVSACLAFGCFVFILFSYVQIFRAVLRIPSEQGRHKAFSTCLPHLAVLCLLISTAIFAYLKPPSISSPSLDLAVSFLYSVMPPAVNPLIYSMRNQEIKDALRELITG
ncbi:olfactory receptor 14A16-like [Tyto alba]|uniref:olfactory receptor 14A16-like n=1 Tax=Tyto alba TaxID=56313 RepID=UPI001C680950|nr:olfactory receptor 14A16-like [Tyto alba]